MPYGFAVDGREPGRTVQSLRVGMVHAVCIPCASHPWTKKRTWLHFMIAIGRRCQLSHPEGSQFAAIGDATVLRVTDQALCIDGHSASRSACAPIWYRNRAAWMLP